MAFHANCLMSTGDHLQEMSKPVVWENKKNVSICHPLKRLPRVLNVTHLIEEPLSNIDKVQNARVAPSNIGISEMCFYIVFYL